MKKKDNEKRQWPYSKTKNSTQEVATGNFEN